MDYMQVAVEQARKAARRGEVPIGCVIVRDGKIIAKGYNQRERKQNCLWHAEIVALNRACRKLKSWRLSDCEMYVTLEPCQMCMGAILNARLRKVYIGARSTTNLNWQTPVELQPNAEAQNILVDFFRNRR
ncbi:MAG: nucleoside deaminase [Eubacteriales bacterium]|nr:nucleoside deaminase [Eubacteriales bacterium]